MKSTYQPLIDLLDSGVWVSADLYTLTLSDGEVLRYTAADVTIRSGIDIFAVVDIFAVADIFLSYLWDATGPRFDDPNGRAKGRWKVGLDVDSWQVRVMPRSVDPLTGEPFPDKIGETGWLAAAAGGFLDGAIVRVERAYLGGWPVPWRTPVEVTDSFTITMFYGRMAVVDVGRSVAILNVNDFRELLGMAMPRNLFQSGCRFTLFGPGCGLTKATYAVAGVVNAVDGNQITATLGFAAGYFDLGTLEMTSGENEGFMRVVKSWNGNVLKMIAPFYYDVQVGDTFTVYPGCQKTYDICGSRFANTANFGGTPYIPDPTTAI